MWIFFFVNYLSEWTVIFELLYFISFNSNIFLCPYYFFQYYIYIFFTISTAHIYIHTYTCRRTECLFLRSTRLYFFKWINTKTVAQKCALPFKVKDECKTRCKQKKCGYVLLFANIVKWLFWRQKIGNKF